MCSPSQHRGGFDLHSVCAHCRDKKQGSDPCIETPPAACSHCDALSSEQKAQLSTPSYKLKKEKKEAKSSTPAKALDTLSPTLVDPALVSVVGVVDGQTTSGLSGLAEKKSKKAESKKSSTSAKLARSDKLVKSSSNRLPQPPARASPPLPLPTQGFLISTGSGQIDLIGWKPCYWPRL